MEQKFKLNVNMIVIAAFVLLFGIVVEFGRTDFLLKLSAGKTEGVKFPSGIPSPIPEEERLERLSPANLILYDPEDDYSLLLSDNFAQTLRYMKKRTELRPLSDIPDVLSGYETIVMASDLLPEPAETERIMAHAERGGRVFFAVRPKLGSALDGVYRKMGIYELGDQYKDASGVLLTSDVLLKGQGAKLSDNYFENSMISVQLDKNARVFMNAGDGSPLLWSIDYGEGRIMVFNGTALSFSPHRGVIAGAMSYLHDDYMYPIFNAKVVYLDDFPAPFPEGTHPAIYNEYSRTTQDFFREIWWPEMQLGAARNDIVYTGVLIQTYNNQTSGPFTDQTGVQRHNLITYGRDLLKMGGEIGIHGYNHQPLTMDANAAAAYDYKPWPDEQSMTDAMREVYRYFKEAFPDLEPQTYVPPSNVSSPEGIRVLREAIPSIRVVASINAGDEETFAYLQEYGVRDGYVDAPRLSSGFEFTDVNRWAFLNGVTLYGQVSHFIHPDDILDEERNYGLGWHQLNRRYHEMMGTLKENYPWLRSLTAAEGAARIEHVLNADILIGKDGNRISVQVNGGQGEIDFLLRTDKKIAGVDGCEAIRVSEDRYLIRSAESAFELRLEAS